MAKSGGGHTIGQGIFIKGDLNGSEDLVVEGRIEGSITLKNHLLVGQTGLLEANVQSEAVTVYGEILGDVSATQKIELNETARVVGDLDAPSIFLADGAKFRGRINMDVPLPRDF